MNRKIAQKISNALMTVRDSYGNKARGRDYSEWALKQALRYLDEIITHIERTSPDEERDFMFSALGALDILIEEENNAQKISMYADSIHRVPFLFTGDERWDRHFKERYFAPFCDVYGNEWHEELLDAEPLPKRRGKEKGKHKGRTIYRFNEENVWSLRAYFGFRLLLPTIVIPLLLATMLLVSLVDYTENNRGERYEVTVSAYEYECSDEYDYLYIESIAHTERFEISRFAQLSCDPDGLLALCEEKGSLIIYATYTSSNNTAPYYDVIHVEDAEGKVYRSYEDSNQMDRYYMIFLGIFALVIFVPYFILFVLMLTVARNPKKFVSHPRFVKFCFPHYSLSLKNAKKQPDMR